MADMSCENVLLFILYCAMLTKKKSPIFFKIWTKNTLFDHE